jgi:hypothetical protein
MYQTDKAALNELIDLLNWCLTFSAAIHNDTIAKFNTLLSLCKMQGMRDEENWFTEIAQYFFELYNTAPEFLKEFLIEDVDR